MVRVHIGGLIKALSAQPAKLLDLIKKFPEGTDALILRIIVIMANKDPIPPELIETVKELYKTKELDGRFVLPILTGLPKVCNIFVFRSSKSDKFGFLGRNTVRATQSCSTIGWI